MLVPCRASRPRTLRLQDRLSYYSLRATRSAGGMRAETILHICDRVPAGALRCPCTHPPQPHSAPSPLLVSIPPATISHVDAASHPSHSCGSSRTPTPSLLRFSPCPLSRSYYSLPPCSPGPCASLSHHPRGAFPLNVVHSPCLPSLPTPTRLHHSPLARSAQACAVQGCKHPDNWTSLAIVPARPEP